MGGTKSSGPVAIQYRGVRYVIAETPVDPQTFRDKFGFKKWVDLDESTLRQDPTLVEELFDLIQTAYGPIGGHVNFKSPQSLLSGNLILHAVDVDSDPDADSLLIYKEKPAGGKLTGLGHDAGPKGKAEVINKAVQELNTTGVYAEVSGAPAAVFLKNGAHVIENPETVKKVLKGKEVTWVGERPDGKFPGVAGWYTRDIDGESHLKIMMGFPRV